MIQFWGQITARATTFTSQKVLFFKVPNSGLVLVFRFSLQPSILQNCLLFKANLQPIWLFIAQIHVICLSEYIKMYTYLDRQKHVT